MKTILLVLISLSLHGQVRWCMNDIARYGHYRSMDVFNHKTQGWEKYKKADVVDMYVIIEPGEERIYMQDSVNKYFKKFKIVDCQMGKHQLVYRCRDITLDKGCEFIFDEDKTVTVQYDPEPVIYKIKQ